MIDSADAPASCAEFRVTANRGNELQLMAGDGRIFSITHARKFGLLVVGDKLVCQLDSDQSPVRVIEQKQRRNTLSRTDRSGNAKALAANVTQMVIVTAPVPPFDLLLIDQYLVAAAAIDCSPLLLINKTDLLNKQSATEADSIQELYRSLGVRVLLTHCTSEDGLATLPHQLQNEVSILVGQSGVGKSSILKQLLADDAIRTAAVSTGSGLGRHTTTVAQWYVLADGGSIIDSAGVRQFGQQHLEPEQIMRGFSDILRHSDGCRFHNCSHRQEPDCAVQNALQAGAIARSRFDNYCKILAGNSAH